MHLQFCSVLLVVLLASATQAASIMKKRDVRCPTTSGGAGSRADPTNCRRYYYCVAGNPEPTLHECQPRAGFSSDLHRCVVLDRSDCAKEPSKEPSR